MATKLTVQQKIAAAKAKKDKIDAQLAKLMSQAADLNADKPGMQSAIKAIENAAAENKVAVADVIKAIAKIKRTGLKIEKATRKAKDPNAPKPVSKVKNIAAKK